MVSSVRTTVVLLVCAGGVGLATQGCGEAERPEPPNVQLETDTGTGTGTGVGGGGTGGGGTDDAYLCQCIAHSNDQGECASCINDSAAGACAEEANFFGGDGASELVMDCLRDNDFAPDMVAECISKTPDQELFLNFWNCGCSQCTAVCSQDEPTTCDYSPTPDDCGCIVDQNTTGSACQTCAQTSRGAACSQEYDACAADTTCDAIVNSCIPGCEGTTALKACISACLGSSDSPSRALAEDYYQCSCFTCTECSSEPECVPPNNTGGGGTGGAGGSGGSPMGGSGGAGGTP